MPKIKSQRLPLVWDSKSHRYRDQQGRFVARAIVTDARNRIVEDTKRKLLAISGLFEDGNISLADWQTQFKDIIKSAHTLAAGIAMGGKANMTAADWGRVGQMLRVQYEALNRFALQLEAGQKLNRGRVSQYAASIRSTFLNAERIRVSAMAMAKWIRTKRESCEDCIQQARRGIQPVAMFPLIGSLRCRHNCGCYLEMNPKS